MRTLAGHGLLSRGMLLHGHGLGGQSFTPALLFAESRPGAWYDPFDKSSVFQDAIGSIPVTTFTQPVGLKLDMSRGLVPGPELVANGDFSDGLIGWSSFGGDGVIEVSADGARLLRPVGGSDEILAVSPHLPVQVGGTHKVTFDITEAPAGPGRLEIRDGSGTFYTILSAGVGSYECFYKESIDTNFALRFASRTEGAPLTVKNVSVRELPGYHRSQSVAAARPTLTDQGLFYDAVDDVIFGSSEVLPVGVSMSHFAVIAPTAAQWLLNGTYPTASSPFGPVAQDSTSSNTNGLSGATFHKNGGAVLTNRGQVKAAFNGSTSILEGRGLTRVAGVGTIAIGGYTSYFYGGHVAEEIYCTTEMADANRPQIMAYLSEKWRITL